MTVNTISSVAEFETNGVTTNYPFYFKFLANEDLVVTYVDPLGVSSTLTLGTHYSANGAGNDQGGSVVTTTALAGPGQLVVSREMDVYQQTSLRNQGKFLAETHEDVFDRLTMLIQQGFAIFKRALVRPYGRDYYDAENRNISNLKDPISAQDAATNNWVRTYLAAVLGAITGPINNALNIFFKGPDNLNYVVQDLSDKFDPAKGAALVGYQGRSLRTKLLERVSIADTAGVDDGVFDNAASFIAAKALVASGGVIYFQRQRANSNYLISGSPDFSNVILDVDEGVKITGGFIPPTNLRVRRSSTLINSTQNYPYELSSQYKKPWADRSIFMSDGDKDNSFITALNTTNDFVSLSTDYLTGDVFAASSAVPQTDGIFWSQTNTAKLFASMTSNCRPGDEITCSFSTGGAYTRVAIIRTTAGYHMVSCVSGNAQPNFTYKPIGSAATTNAFTFTGQGTYQSYYGENSHWGIRIYDHQSYSVLWSGQEITGKQIANGTIIQVGFGWVPGTVTAISMQGFARARNVVTGGKRDISVLTVGDSLSEPIQGGWQSALQEAMDLTDGIRINAVINQAIGGQTSAQQLAILQSQGIQGCQYVFLNVGTNDIQQGVAPATTISNVSAMIDYVRAQGANPITWIPPLWYPNTFTSGTGQNTSGYQSGSALRVLLLRLAGTKTCKCVDLTQVMGTAVADYRNNYITSGFDPVLRDNIHPTTYGYRMIGWALAKALLSLHGGVISREQDQTFLPSSGLKNGWGMTFDPPTFSFNASGELKLTGVLDAGTVTAGTVMYTLPETMRPVRTSRTTVPTNNGSCSLQVATSGDVSLITAATGAIWVSIDIPAFKTLQ
ncbi:GDSL-type esterase/lipase family protein [Pseudomonas sp. LY-1]